MASISLKNIVKDFASASRVVDDVCVDVADGSFCVLLGPSGCGKSTLLRIIAGLEHATSGDIVIGARRVNDVSPKDRDIAMVFQNYALYPHLSVVDNIAFPLEARGVSKRERRERAAKVAASVQLESLLDRKPSELSGGQRQRVALARAIIREPKAFLFDEPLSNLDAKMRQVMRVELRALHRRLGITSVYVTHDQEEALALADQIVVLAAGKVRQVGSPTDIYNTPADRFVAGFVGVPSMNFLPCTLDASGTSCIIGRSDSSTGLSTIPLPAHWAEPLHAHFTRQGGKNGNTAGNRCVLGIRPSSLQLCTPDSAALRLRIRSTELLGDVIDVHATVQGDHEVVARLPAHAVHASGSLANASIDCTIDFSGAHMFEASGEGTRLCGGAGPPEYAPQSRAGLHQVGLHQAGERESPTRKHEASLAVSIDQR